MDTDEEAIADTARFCCATLALSVVPIMSVNGYVSEAYVRPSDLSDLAEAVDALGARLYDRGSLGVSNIRASDFTTWSNRKPGWQMAVLEHMAALRFAEFRSDGCLFYSARNH